MIKVLQQLIEDFENQKLIEVDDEISCLDFVSSVILVIDFKNNINKVTKEKLKNSIKKESLKDKIISIELLPKKFILTIKN